MTRSGPPESLNRGRVARILVDFFVTGRGKQLEEGHGARIPWTQDKDPYDLRVMDEDLRIAMKRYDPKRPRVWKGSLARLLRSSLSNDLGGSWICLTVYTGVEGGVEGGEDDFA